MLDVKTIVNTAIGVMVGMLLVKGAEMLLNKVGIGSFEQEIL